MSLLDFLFPKSCLGCGKRGLYICQKCLNSTPFANTICPVCTRFSFFGQTHTSCKSKNSLDGLINLWIYRGVIRAAVIKVKYNFATSVLDELCVLSEIELRKFKLPKKVILVPIPLYKKRNNWRGFNQSTLLASKISAINGWKVIPDLLIKVEDTHPQVHLNKQQRHLNISGKFTINKKYSEKFKYYPLYIFDDVWTTGSTIKEAGRVLKEAGFKNVWGVTIARGY